METPPQLPGSKPPLGRSFFVILSVPVILMAAIAAIVRTNTNVSMLLPISGFTTLGCAVYLACVLGPRMSRTDGGAVATGVLMFFGLLAFYTFVFFIGCTAMVALG